MFFVLDFKNEKLMAFVVYYMSSCHFFIVLFHHESSFDHFQQLTNLTSLFLKFSTMDYFVHVSINVKFSNVLCVYGHFASYGSSINIINMGVAPTRRSIWH